MVGDGFRSATMQAAWRPEEESDDQASAATMQAAWRPEEESEHLPWHRKPEHQINSSTDAIADWPRQHPMTVQISGPDGPIWSAAGRPIGFPGGSTPPREHGLVGQRWCI